MAKNIPSDNLQIDDLIVAFLAGSASSEEREQLLAWVKESPENKEHFRLTRQAWLVAMTGQKDKFDSRKQQAFDHFHRRISSTAYKQRGGLTISLTARRLMGRAAVAAVALCIGAGVGLWLDARITEQRLIASSYAIEAPRGAIIRVELPDGSTAWLNADSRLSYDGGFGVTNRDVRLNGEGYFEVAKLGHDMPFRVGADEVLVEVLGTKFDVSSYANDPDIVVTLTQGSVSLTADGISTLLHPGEIASYNRANGETTVRPMGEEAPYWQTGKLNFDNSSLLQITRVLERAYNVRFEVKTDTIGDLRFHGEFDVDNNSIDDIMQVMAATHHLRYRIRGNTVVIY